MHFALDALTPFDQYSGCSAQANGMSIADTMAADDTKYLAIRVTPELHARVKAAAASEQKQLQQYVVEALTAKLKTRKTAA
jgi:predicted HicB family RNase H-like nuclease